MTNALFVHHTEPFKYLSDNTNILKLCVPSHFEHMIFQVAQLSKFVYDVDKKFVLNYLRYFANTWMTYFSQRKHFTQMQVFLYEGAFTELYFIDLLYTVLSASFFVACLEYLIQRATLFASRFYQSIHFIDLDKLHSVSWFDRYFLISCDLDFIFFLKQ